MVDACKAAGCEFVIYSSCCDPEYFSDKVKHIKGFINKIYNLVNINYNNIITCLIELLNYPTHFYLCKYTRFIAIINLIYTIIKFLFIKYNRKASS